VKVAGSVTYRLEKLGSLVVGCLGLAGTFEIATPISIALVALAFVQFPFTVTSPDAAGYRRGMIFIKRVLILAGLVAAVVYLTVTQ
jgi:hypothetical protein